MLTRKEKEADWDKKHRLYHKSEGETGLQTSQKCIAIQNDMLILFC